MLSQPRLTDSHSNDSLEALFSHNASLQRPMTTRHLRCTSVGSRSVSGAEVFAVSRLCATVTRHCYYYNYCNDWSSFWYDNYSLRLPATATTAAVTANALLQLETNQTTTNGPKHTFAWKLGFGGDSWRIRVGSVGDFAHGCSEERSDDRGVARGRNFTLFGTPLKVLMFCAWLLRTMRWSA